MSSCALVCSPTAFALRIVQLHRSQIIVSSSCHNSVVPRPNFQAGGRKRLQLFCSNNFTCSKPAPVAQWLTRRTVGRKVWGSNPIRVMWDFSALAGSYPELGVLWAQWEGWNDTTELHPLHGCVFEGVALIT